MTHSGKDLVLGGMFVALALVIPILFHAIGLGSTFLPMFFPLITAGFLISLPVALVVGFISPIVSTLLTGMPPLFPPVAFIMMAEGTVLAGLPAILYQKWKIPIFLTLLMTVFSDRLVLLGAVLLTARLMHLPEGVLGLSSLIRGVPGILLILTVLPPLVKGLEKKMRTMPVMD